MYVGKDLTHPINYNGKIGYVALNLGDGAFKDGKDFGHKDDSNWFKLYYN